MKKVFAVVLLAFSLGACEFISTTASLISPDWGTTILRYEDKAMTETAELIETYCDTVGDQIIHRERFVMGVNDRMDIREDGSRPHMIAQDCDGDGKSDF